MPEPHRIIIEMDGGLIQAVGNVPEGVEVEVRDFDVEGQTTEDDDRIRQTSRVNGEEGWAFVNFWSDEEHWDITHEEAARAAAPEAQHLCHDPNCPQCRRERAEQSEEHLVDRALQKDAEQRLARLASDDPLRRALEALENGDVGDATEWINAAIEERGQAAPAAQGTLFAVMCYDRDSGSPYDLLLAPTLPALLDKWVPVIFTDYEGNPLSVAEHRQEIEAMFPEGLGNLTWERARELASQLADRDNERTYYLAQPDVGEWAGLE